MTPKAKAGGRTCCMAQPVARSATTSASARRAPRSFIGEFLQAVERLEGFLRAQLVGPDLGERGAQILVGGGRGSVRGAEEIRLARARAQLLLQACEVAARRAHHVLGDAREVRDMDA